MGRYGFAAIPLLIFIFSTVVVGGITGYTRILQIEKQIKEKDTQATKDLGQLYKIDKDTKALREKVEDYSKLGVEIPESTMAASTIRQLILEKQFLKVKNFIAEIDKKIEAALTAKKEAERAATVDVRDKLETKLVEFKKRGVNVTEVETKLPEIRSLVDSGDLAAAREEISKLSERLDQLLAIKLEEEKKAQKKAVTTTPVSQSLAGATYERKTVSTARGNFVVDVLTLDLGQIQVVTDTANSADCDNNCPTKPLAQYVADRAGIGGINGTYFCPPDYASCAGKVASFDFPVYNTILGKFINAKTLFWSGSTMIAFDTANKPHFFKEANQFGGINLKAAIVNYPALLSGSQIVVNEGALPSNLGQVKGNRGALGFSGNTLFAVVGRSATVGDMAYVMQALGAINAMNLDGGGSSALYFAGSYKVGPGRNLPNAVIFVK